VHISMQQDSGNTTCICYCQLTPALACFILALQELHSTRQRHADQLAQLAQAHEQELAGAAGDAAAAVSRHLAFIDRLMADKEQLSKQLAEQHSTAKVGRLLGSWWDVR
jgi:hypothetical protein